MFKWILKNYLENIVDTRETSRGKVREIVGLSAPMNKIGRPDYLSNNKKYLIVAAAEIEGFYGLSFDSNHILGQSKHVIKAINF